MSAGASPGRGGATMLLSAVLIIIGIVLVARSAGAGGGPLSVGVVLGVLFVAAGIGRLWLERRASR